MLYIIRSRLVSLSLTVVILFFLNGIFIAAQEGPALWKAEEGQSTVYFLGTIHLMTEDVEWFEGTIEDAFRSSETLTVEVNPSEVSREEHITTIRELAILPSDQKLSDIISEKQLQRLEELLQPAGVSNRTIQRWRPWFAALTVTGFAAQEAGFHSKYGVDVQLLEKARNRGMEIHQLETFREQLEMFSSLERDEAAYFLKDSLENKDEMQKLFERLKRNWLRAELSDLKSLLLDSMEENRSFYETVYVERNRRWLPEILKLLEKPGTHFVAVGTGHLIGEDGIIAMLKKKDIPLGRY